MRSVDQTLYLWGWFKNIEKILNGYSIGQFYVRVWELTCPETPGVALEVTGGWGV